MSEPKEHPMTHAYDNLIPEARDAARYRWLREQVRDEEDTVEVQAFFWNTSKPREFDEWVDAAMAESRALGAPKAPVPEAIPVPDGAGAA